MIVNPNHDYCDLTLFCRKCGQAMFEVKEQDCMGGGNVIGITHIIAVRSLWDVTGAWTNDIDWS